MLLLLVLWPTLGLATAGWGMHTTHPIYGPAAVDAGILLGNAGVLITLLWYYNNRRP